MNWVEDNSAFVFNELKIIQINGKTITNDNFGYRLYYHLWVDFLPIRIALIKFKHFAWRIASSVKRRLGKKK